jgi:hypothetical protein
LSRRTHEIHSDICKRSKFKNDGLPDLTLVQARAPVDRSILANDRHAAGMLLLDSARFHTNGRHPCNCFYTIDE